MNNLRNIVYGFPHMELLASLFIIWFSVSAINGIAVYNAIQPIEMTTILNEPILVHNYHGNGGLLEPAPIYPDNIFTFFHFNTQFKCGDTIAEANIINSSIYNLLLFYDYNKAYKFDFEIQGYAIELMAEDYPHVFELVKKLNDRGQLELIVTHYSDQLLVAYPEIDLRKSIDLSMAVLEKYNLTRSNVFACQEYQYSEALVNIMKDYNYTVLVSQESTFKQYLPVLSNISYNIWTHKDLFVFFDKGFGKYDCLDNTTLSYGSAYFSDGEGINTHKYKNDFVYDPVKQREFEEKLYKYKKSGCEFLTISELLTKSIYKGIPLFELPAIPCSIQGDLFLWSGNEPEPYERDVEVLTKNYQARTSLLAVESLLEYMKYEGSYVTDGYQQEVDELWKQLLFAEVSDSTGWHPDPCEVQYSLDKASYVISKSQSLSEMMLSDMSIFQPVVIDILHNNIISNPNFSIPSITDSPIAFNVSVDYNITTIYKYSNTVYKAVVELNNSETIENTIDFFMYDNTICYAPMSSMLFDLYGYKEQSPKLTLSNGFVYLGNNISIVNVPTVRYPMFMLDNNQPKFKEEYVRPYAVYEFYIVFGSQYEGLEFANRLNVNPYVFSSDLSTIVYYTGT